MTSNKWGVFAFILAVALPTTVRAQAAAGVSDERVNLPEAPGSISGVGENATAEGNQGAMRYRVAIEVPKGFPGLTPSVDLSYSSSGGSDVLGMGWSMPLFSIERMTSKGLQKYDLDDRFVAEGGDELVRVGQAGTTATYRSRFESGFVRYTWRARGTGEDGYWTAEFPDGRVGYYGADAQGAPVLTAQVRVPTTNKVFRWCLVAIVDRFGHAMTANWTKDPGGESLLERLDYAFEGSNARHSVRFTYEARPDVRSDAKPGFESKLTQRLKDLRIYSGTEIVRSYVLAYEADGVAGGASRLRSVARLGRGDVAYPVTFSFSYSKTLGGVCDATCEKPFVKAMGSLGVDFSQGRATLIDMNGDALPDVLVSTASGVHTFFYSHLDAEGVVSFSPTGTPSALTTGSSPFILGDPKVQVMDLNGDGFVDITQARLPQVMCNNGSGDWVSAAFCTATPGTAPDSFVEDDTADTGQADPRYVRFFDYDNDKRIDWLRTDLAGTTSVLANTVTGITALVVDPIGATFDESATSTLQLADMNGDGLQDPVQLLVTGSAVQAQFRLNLGFGRWTAWRTVTLTGLDPSQAAAAQLQDINGDNLADVVAVVGNEIKLALNRNGDRFDAVQTLSTASLASGVIPNRGTSTVVFADMNGNGSDDIVWIEPGGAISYLELFPVRPNLLARIDNGIGGIQLATYGTSITEQARDTAASMPWANRVPNPMTLLTRLTNYVTLTSDGVTGLRERTDFRYHSGYYDGVEKQFRGYEGVERELLNDMSRDAQEPGLMVEAYDVGRTSPALAGLPLSARTYAGLGRALLSEVRNTWEACPVAQVPAGTLPTISFPCNRVSTFILTEREAANAVTTRVERDFDGFGNVTRTRNLGVVNRGTPEAPMACAACTASGTFGDACGPDCMGDEDFSESDFIDPGTAAGDLWMVGNESRRAQGAVASMLSEEVLTFYDGADFVGRPTGFTRGSISRIAHRSGPGAADFVDVERYRHDSNGNLIESLTANASVSDTTNHRRLYTWDAAGLQLTSLEVRTGGTGLTGIRRDFTNETAFEQVSQASAWYPVMGSTPLASAQQTRYRYDEHGRLSRVLDPGDTDTTVSQEYSYQLGDPSSRITSLRRSSPAGAQDLVAATCLDGRGRAFQRRAQIASNSWQVDGFVEFDGKGAVVRRYQPYLSTTAACELAPPSNVPFMSFTYDPVGRPLTTTEADGSTTRVEYGPLEKRMFDEEDTDTTSAFANTPDVVTMDGLFRPTRFSRLLTSGGAPAVTLIAYDARGNVGTVRDPAGNLHAQTYDQLGRLTRVDDPNAGSTTFEYDPAGNEIKETDARGVVTLSQWDGANRLIALSEAGNEAATRRSWTYDYLPGCAECTNAGGRLAASAWPGSFAGEDRLGYDTEGKQVFSQRTINGKSFVIRSRYDGGDRLVGVTYPGGLSLDSTFDGANRLTQIAGSVEEVSYNERGQTSRLRFSNGATTDYTFDARLRLASLATKGADGNPLLQLGYTRSLEGKLTAVTDGALAGRVRHDGRYTPDGWGRPTQVELSREGGLETLSFTFDQLDNILSATSSLGAQSRAHVGTMGYDAARPNAVTTAGGVSRGYDPSGRMVSRGAVTLNRDFLGRIVTATGGSVDGEFAYGADGERVARVEGDSVTWYLADDFELRDGIAVVYARVGDQLVSRLESDALAATVLSDLAPATGAGTLTPTGDRTIDIGDAWLAQGQATGVVQLSGGPTPSPVGQLLRSAARRLLMEDVSWLHQDHLSTVVLATDASGAVRGEQSLYPTGFVRESNGFVDARSGSSGMEFDEATGLIHFPNRDLDPQTGRWDAPDPAFEEIDEDELDTLSQATVGYAYVGNAYFDATDPSGLAFEKVKAKWNARGGGPSARAQATRQKAARKELANRNKATAKAKATRQKAEKKAAAKIVSDQRKQDKKDARAADILANGARSKKVIALRVVQALMSLTSIAMTVVSAVRAGEAKGADNAADKASLETASQNYAVVASSFGAGATLIGTGFDLKSGFEKQKKKDP